MKIKIVEQKLAFGDFSVYKGIWEMDSLEVEFSYLLNSSYDQLEVFDENEGWTEEPKNPDLKKRFDVLIELDLFDISDNYEVGDEFES